MDDGLPQEGASGTARPTGKVVGIIKRNWRTRGYCGSLQPQEDRGGRGAQGVLFCPVERRFPKIRLQTRQVTCGMQHSSRDVRQHCPSRVLDMHSSQHVIACAPNRNTLSSSDCSL